MTFTETSPKWQVLSKESGPDLGIFKVRFDMMENLQNGRIMKALILEANDWVTVVAITPNEEIVVVCQYRVGIGKITTEVPGGIIDPGESSQEAAIRELREETGFTSTEWKYLGVVEPNPAIQNNLCHHWLAKNAIKTHEPDLDEGEDVQAVTLSFTEIRSKIQSGELRHSLTLSALSRVSLFWNSIEIDD